MASTRGCGYVLVIRSREREREREKREREAVPTHLNFGGYSPLPLILGT